jgi:hypothetical protein
MHWKFDVAVFGFREKRKSFFSIHQCLGEIWHLPQDFSFLGGTQVLPHILPGATANIERGLKLLVH